MNNNESLFIVVYAINIFSVLYCIKSLKFDIYDDNSNIKSVNTDP